MLVFGDVFVLSSVLWLLITCGCYSITESIINQGCFSEYFVSLYCHSYPYDIHIDRFHILIDGFQSEIDCQ